MKRQRKLDTFFTGNALSTRTYFYFDWTAENPAAKWLFTRPTSINFEAEVKWKDSGIHVTVCGFTGNSLHPKEEQTEQVDTATLSLLKSHLQKCIRRGLTNKALETSCFLMKYDLNAFIRRLPIIMMEDVKVHVSFIPLIWLTAAISKGFPVTQSVKSWLLGVVKYLCEEKNEYYSNHNVWSYTETGKLTTNQLLKETEKFEPTTRDLLISLLFRKSYGGMKGDMEMIAAYERVFVKLGPLSKSPTQAVEKKLKTDPDVIEKKVIIDLEEEETQPSALVSLIPIEPVEFSQIRIQPIDEIELCAVDFHCYPAMVNLIKQQFITLDEDDIKSAIWHCSSKTNFRIELSQQELESMESEIRTWDIIKDHVKTLAKNYLKHIASSYANKLPNINNKKT
jgi:hypothetical protein